MIACHMDIALIILSSEANHQGVCVCETLRYDKRQQWVDCGVDVASIENCVAVVQQLCRSRDALDFTIQKNLCIQKLMKLKIYSTQYDSMDTFDPRSRSRYFGVGTGVRPSELDSAPPRSSKLRFYFPSIMFAIFAYLIPESYSQWEPWRMTLGSHLTLHYWVTDILHSKLSTQSHIIWLLLH